MLCLCVCLSFLYSVLVVFHVVLVPGFRYFLWFSVVLFCSLLLGLVLLIGFVVSGCFYVFFVVVCCFFLFTVVLVVLLLCFVALFPNWALPTQVLTHLVTAWWLCPAEPGSTSSGQRFPPAPVPPAWFSPAQLPS